MRTPEDYKTYFAKPNIGAAETGVAQGWWLIENACPGIKKVVIHRELNEVITSLMEADMAGVAFYDKNSLTKHMEYGKRVLDKIAARRDVLSINFHDLKKMETCQKLFEHCLPYSFDIKHWAKLKNQNIQINMKDMFKYYDMHREEIARFKKLCKLELIRLRRMEPDNPMWKD